MSSLFASIILDSVRSKGRATQKGIIEAAAKQKALSLSGTLQLRADEGELSDATILDFYAAAEEYVEALIAKEFPDFLDEILAENGRSFSEKGALEIETVYGIQDKHGKSMSALTLATLLNVTLYQYTKELMHSPALNWKTGRLAHSGKVTKIVPEIGKKGMGSIYFTYMLYPYATFEPGGAQGSGERSPVALFTKAINAALQDILLPKSTKFIVRSQ